MSSRRDFLRQALAGAGAVAGLATSGPAAARGNPERLPEAVGLLFDGTLCIGCKACVAACKRANDLPVDYRTPIEAQWDLPVDTTARTFNVIKVYKDGVALNKDVVEDGYAFSKTSCLHCVDPSCVSACPVSAMTKDAVTGIVEYDPQICIGCRYCVAACPFGIPKFDYESATGKIGKCELCRHRMPDGHYAACAEVCPTGATLYGKVSDLQAEAKRRLGLTAGSTTLYPRGHLGKNDQPSWEGKVAPYTRHLYGEKELGGTQVMHLAGVPFERLGYPTLPERSFASRSETLQHTLYGGLVLPIALFGAMTWVARKNSKHHDDEPGASPGPLPGGDEPAVPGARRSKEPGRNSAGLQGGGRHESKGGDQ